VTATFKAAKEQVTQTVAIDVARGNTAPAEADLVFQQSSGRWRIGK
jgi:hypothetical protein